VPKMTEAVSSTIIAANQISYDITSRIWKDTCCAVPSSSSRTLPEFAGPPIILVLAYNTSTNLQ
jgi:hypothetical protein